MQGLKKPSPKEMLSLLILNDDHVCYYIESLHHGKDILESVNALFMVLYDNLSMNFDPNGKCLKCNFSTKNVSCLPAKCLVKYYPVKEILNNFNLNRFRTIKYV